VIGSFALLVTAIRTPDQHVTVPNDVPRPSSIPPAEAAPVPAEQSRGETGNTP